MENAQDFNLPLYNRTDMLYYADIWTVQNEFTIGLLALFVSLFMWLSGLVDTNPLPLLINAPY